MAAASMPDIAPDVNVIMKRSNLSKSLFFCVSLSVKYLLIFS
jgi:hypothetical protein